MLIIFCVELYAWDMDFKSVTGAVNVARFASHWCTVSFATNWAVSSFVLRILDYTFIS